MTVRLRKWKDAKGKQHEAWVVDVVFEHPNGRVERVRKVSPVPTRRGAEAYERELRAALQSGTRGLTAREVPTLESFKGKVITRAEVDCKPSSVQAKRQLFKSLLVPEFGRLRLDAIDSARIDAFKAKHLKRGLSAKTLNNALSVLRSTLELAVEYGELGTMPRAKFWMRPAPPPFDFLDFDEAERLIAACEPEWKALVTVALHTGLRSGELQGLQWDAVDLRAGRLRVMRSWWRGHLGAPKNHKTREVPLNTTATAALKSVLSSKVRGPFVFSYASNAGGKNCMGAALHNDTMRNGILRQARLAGLRPIGWHTLRHTFASHLVMRGVPLKAVQELMGHATMDMTMRYAHLSPDVRKDAVRALEGPPERHMGGTRFRDGT